MKVWRSINLTLLLQFPSLHLCYLTVSPPLVSTLFPPVPLLFLYCCLSVVFLLPPLFSFFLLFLSFVFFLILSLLFSPFPFLRFLLYVHFLLFRVSTLDFSRLLRFLFLSFLRSSFPLSSVLTFVSLAPSRSALTIYYQILVDIFRALVAYASWSNTTWRAS